MPQRIQRRRTPGWRMPDGAIYVGRPTKWGNPFRAVIDDDYRWSVVETVPDLGDIDVEVCANKADATATAVQLFRVHVSTTLDLTPLTGRDVACWCREGDPCHADVLLELANGDH